MSENVVLPMAPNHISQVGITVTATEFLMMLGQTRMVVVNEGNSSAPSFSPAVEWTAALSLAPTVAKAMPESLEKSINYYEKNFGKIPADPNAHIMQS